MSKEYTLELRFDSGGFAEYRIVKLRERYRTFDDREEVVFSRPYNDGEDLGGYNWPQDVRKKYEELTGKPEFSETLTKPFNIVPALLADKDEVAYDCPCAWAQRVINHAVYCENEGWLYSPRKCRRGPGAWTGEPSQESCPGFKPNEHFKVKVEG